MRAHDLPPDRLILELTETLTISQLEVVDRVLGRLRDEGVRLALDDFGTGYSSLSVLSRIPVNELKIDREFVTSMETSPEAAAVIRSTVDLARSLDLAVVAEGVESEPQRLALWEMGCAAGQGHLFARPMRGAAAARRAPPGLGRAPGHPRAAAARGGLGHPVLAARRPARSTQSHRAFATLASVILAKVDRAGGGLAVDLGLYALSAAFAGVTAATSTLVPHRAWGAVAVVGYAAATVAVLVQWATKRAGTRIRAIVTAAAWTAVAWVPMVIQAVERAGGRLDRAQEEVVVVEHAGARLIDTGTPYLSNDAISALPTDERLLGYVPYQPGMSLFGLPRAVAGDAWWTDSRIWFAVATLAAIGGTAWLLRDRRPGDAAGGAVRHGVPGLRAHHGHRRRRPAGPRALPAGARAVRGPPLRRRRARRRGRRRAQTLRVAGRGGAARARRHPRPVGPDPARGRRRRPSPARARAAGSGRAAGADRQRDRLPPGPRAW